MRRRRFPLFSALLVALLAASIGYMTFLDADVPRRAFSQIGAAFSRLGQSLSLVGRAGGEATGGFIFAPSQATPTPASMPMLVNLDHPLADGYVPGDLVRMRGYCDEAVVYVKGSEIDGDREAVDALMVMLKAAVAQGVGNWQISAGYRSIAYQQELWDSRVYQYRKDGLSGEQARAAAAKYVARPGCSEHHTGLAFDVTVPGESFALTDQSKWLAEHCWDYGFIMRYTQEKSGITGFAAEPWHIRYVGQPHARIMRERDWCLEEYVNAAR